MMKEKQKYLEINQDYTVVNILNVWMFRVMELKYKKKYDGNKYLIFIFV